MNELHISNNSSDSAVTQRLYYTFTFLTDDVYVLPLPIDTLINAVCAQVIDVSTK